MSVGVPGQRLSNSNGVRIQESSLESLMDSVGELIVIKSQILNQCAAYPMDLRLNSVVGQLDKSIRDIKDKVLSMRMLPLRGIFQKTQRVVRDLSVKLNKSVDFHMNGEEVELDRNIVEMLSDPLLHIARNSLDHGIESEADRKKQGKSAVSTLTLSAKQIGDRVIINISDDGAGINRSKVIAKAKKIGLLPKDHDGKGLTDEEIFQFIFAPGFSTAEVVTDVSGRGVGMDIIKSNVEKMKGKVEISSVPNRGTSITITVPTTTTITDGILVTAKENIFVVPIDCVRELVDGSLIEQVPLEGKKRGIRHRDEVFPMMELSQIFTNHLKLGNREVELSKMYVLIEYGGNKVFVGVDSVMDQAQVILKSLGECFSRIKGIYGAAVLGNGRVALVVNPYGLIDLALNDLAFSVSSAA